MLVLKSKLQRNAGAISKIRYFIDEKTIVNLYHTMMLRHIPILHGVLEMTQLKGAFKLSVINVIEPIYTWAGKRALEKKN